MDAARAAGGSILAVLFLLVGLACLGGPAEAAPAGRVRLVRQTSWVAPGDTLSLTLRTADVVDPAALELAVSLHPAVRSRVELDRSTRGEGLSAPLGARTAVVPLSQVPAAVDGTLSVQVATEEPGRFRLRGAGIYPVQVELRELGGGETVDRFTTHLLALEGPKDGSRLGAAVVLALSAPPSTGTDASPGPPAGASALADAATGLSTAPEVPLTVAPTPEVLDSLAASDPATAAALRTGLANHDVLGRPYVNLDVPALGATAAPLVSHQLETGREAVQSVLGKPPIGGIWLADEPLDGPALVQVVAAGASRLLLPQAALGPTGPAVPSPLRPVTVTASPVPSSPADQETLSATALVADGALASRLDGKGAALDQPLIAHHLLADLAAIATLPAEQGSEPPDGPLDRRVATVLAPRAFIPTGAFLTELLGGLAASPVLRAVDLATAFSVPVEPPAPAPRPASTSRSRRGSTTTAPAATGPTLAPLPPDAASRGIGDVVGDALWQLSTSEQVLAEPTPVEGPEPGAEAIERARRILPADDLRRRLLVATSADLPVEEQRSRLRALAEGAKADLDAIRMSEARSLRLTARTGQLPVGIFNDTGRTARVLLQLDSEKLDFPRGNSAQVVLDRRTNTKEIPVRVRASGSFPVKVRLLTPDGSRVLEETEYVVRANSIPGVAVAVSGAAVVVLAGWWAKTLLPERRHARGRHRRRGGRGVGRARAAPPSGKHPARAAPQSGKHQARTPRGGKHRARAAPPSGKHPARAAPQSRKHQARAPRGGKGWRTG